MINVQAFLQPCLKLKQSFQAPYANMQSLYNHLQNGAILEQQINDTLTRKCQGAVNYCGLKLMLRQKVTKYSTVYFFKRFGLHYNSYIGSLVLVKSMNTKEANRVPYL